MRNSIIVAVGCATVIMAVDPTIQPSRMEAAAAANCFPMATACPDSPTYPNSTLNFQKPPSPTGQPASIPDSEEDDNEDDNADDDVSAKPGNPEKMPSIPNKIPGQHVMPDDHYLETVTISTVVCVPTVITSVISHKKPKPIPAPRPALIQIPDQVYLPKPSASAYRPDKTSPIFTASASLAELSSSLVFIVGAVVYLVLA
ncbi:hypothetical protein OnM2_077073 [Erysiphe neolycopersici]|uniref:Uncharacterized protein n=1 Tax=Erysiphe neolycopersici TaxID=212602 RepID=A0A420HI38_9PEZI|nr:hypothetical protein OnM2_077073 [Erysiphe neolycopersici]